MLHSKRLASLGPTRSLSERETRKATRPKSGGSRTHRRPGQATSFQLQLLAKLLISNTEFFSCLHVKRFDLGQTRHITKPILHSCSAPFEKVLTWKNTKSAMRSASASACGSGTAAASEPWSP